MAALRLFSNVWRSQSAPALSLLTVKPQLTQIRTFKDKDVLELRCKDCYYTKLEDRWHVLCRSHPRHKQRERIDDPRQKWIVTHVTRGGRPFQKKPEAYILNLAPPGGYDYRKRFFYPNWDEIKQTWFPKQYGK